MQTAVVIVILALAGAYLFMRFRRSLSGGGCGCGCSGSKKRGCAGCASGSCARPLEPYRAPQNGADRPAD